MGIHTSFADVPDRVRGNQTYVDAPRLVDIQRSPIYLPLVRFCRNKRPKSLAEIHYDAIDRYYICCLRAICIGAYGSKVLPC